MEQRGTTWNHVEQAMTIGAQTLSSPAIMMGHITKGHSFVIYTLIIALECHDQPDSFYQQHVSIEQKEWFPGYYLPDYEQAPQCMSLSKDSTGCFRN